MVARWFATPLWLRVLGALLAGILAGLVLGPAAATVKPVGDLFIRLIKMLVVPLIFVSLVSGVTAMEEASRLGRIGVKTLLAFVATSLLAVTGGIVMASLIRPGIGAPTEGMQLPDVAPAQLSAIDMLLDIVPTNPAAALADGTVLQIIFFALVFGFAIKAVGSAADPVRHFFNGATEVVLRITHWVMEFTPFGVFALIAAVVGTTGLAVLQSLGLLVLTLFAACLVHILLVPTLLVGIIGRLNLGQFYRGIFDAQLVAFSTSTSAGTLPVTLRCLQDNIGVSRAVSSFVLPMGATVNMDGTAIYLGIVAVFAAQMFGQDLTLTQYGTIMLTGTLVSIGAAAVPSASLALMPMVLTPLGMPVEVVGLVATVDRPMDMMRTATNVTGDAAVATMVARTEGELDEEVFQHRPIA
ncbi:MAG: dicarboxylate/amino acid:cation symporter [Pseudomonadota bacterium]